MSTNRKNKAGPNFLKNFTKNIEARCIIIENANAINGDLQKSINSINDEVNKIIQDLNIRIADRQLPYITLTVQYAPTLDKQSRFFIHSDDTTELFEAEVKAKTNSIGSDISHMVDILIAAGYKELIISSFGFDAEIVVAHHFFECAIIDVLLDIVMFNSYSFLRKLSIEEKHNFSFRKYQYYKKHSLQCFYNCAPEKELYYSFAFSARKNEHSFDASEYIILWNQFIQECQHDSVHKEDTILNQLKFHADYHELPKNLHKRFVRKPKGAYLVMRTNKDRTEDLHPFICSVFGLKEYEKGKVKIVPIAEFEKYKPLFENLDVSAFKVVK